MIDLFTDSPERFLFPRTRREHGLTIGEHLYEGSRRALIIVISVIQAIDS